MKGKHLEKSSYYNSSHSSRKKKKEIPESTEQDEEGRQLQNHMMRWESFPESQLLIYEAANHKTYEQIIWTLEIAKGSLSI